MPLLPLLRPAPRSRLAQVAPSNYATSIPSPAAGVISYLSWKV
jgi:hypothetical protein